MVMKFNLYFLEALHAVLIHHEHHLVVILNIRFIARAATKGISSPNQFKSFNIHCSDNSCIPFVLDMHQVIVGKNLELLFAFWTGLIKTQYFLFQAQEPAIYF